MTIHIMDHPTIKFSSVNPQQVKFYSTLLSSVSADDVRLGKIEGRHALLINMGLAGNCPLLDEYQQMLTIRRKYIDSTMETARIPHNLARHDVLAKVTDDTNEIMLVLHGWDFRKTHPAW